MDGRCRKHPEHRQFKGVCPFCLRERLNTLSASSSSAATTIASSTASSSSSKPTGSGLSSVPPGSPPHDQAAAKPPAPSLKPPESLKKSRSLPFPIGKQSGGARKAAGGAKKDKGKQKKPTGEKGGFWSKLMMSSFGSLKRKQVEEDNVLKYSKTLKEKPGAKWVIF